MGLERLLREEPHRPPLPLLTEKHGSQGARRHTERAVGGSATIVGLVGAARRLWPATTGIDGGSVTGFRTSRGSGMLA